jgi:hypothetical protein
LALEVQYKLHSEPTPRIVVISGFAVAHRGLLFWITAAHCLESLKKLRNAAGVELGPVRLHDQFPHPAAQAIPIDLDSMLQYAFGDPVTDGGIALPRQMVQELVAANPQLKPLQFDSAAPDGFEHSCYCIAGLPTEFQKSIVVDSREYWLTHWSGKVLCITSHLDVHEGDAIFPEGVKARPGCMYGLIDTKTVVNDIDGMSGGPVFEVLRNGEQWHWRLVGVQSSWFRNLQLVCIARTEQLRDTADWICDRIPGAHPKQSL